MYTLRPPAAPLRPWIEHYWFVDAPPGAPVDLRVDVFVDARADLVFNFGAPWHRRVRGGPTVSVGASCLDAQRLVPLTVEQRGDVHVCGVRFRLGGLGPFVRSPLAAFTGGTPPIGEVFGPAAEAVDRTLAATPDPDERAALLDRWLLSELRPDTACAAVADALPALEEGSVAEAADAAGVGIRQLERAFARAVGVPPKTIARVLRFQRVLRALMRDPAATLADVASAAGYFDQAHMIRDFRRFSGGVPRGYRGYYPPQGPADFAPNVVAFVQDDPSARG